MRNFIVITVMLMMILSIMTCLRTSIRGGYLKPAQIEYPVKKSSRFIGERLVVKKPCIIMKNLPYYLDINIETALNTYTITSRKSSGRLDAFTNQCANLIGPDRLVTPIRIEYVPVGTELTVIGEFNFISSYGYEGNSPIHMLLLTDSKKRIVEIQKIQYELMRETPSPNINPIDPVVDEIARSFTTGVLGVFATIQSSDRDMIQKFISDFKLQEDVYIEDNTTAEVTTLIIRNQDAFMTLYYFFPEWSIYGKWKMGTVQQ